MTASDWKKITKQLRNKKAKLSKFLRHNKPKDRKTGIAKYKCERCGRFGAHISSYNLNLCRQCFREIAEEIGFKKYS
ncbi:30S ribosomal protein S14 [Candidatus Pacearchaeota archaeon]|nr:30S ribosomal protein S14 [Candidatus Pacearchaeota archaeon]